MVRTDAPSTGVGVGEMPRGAVIGSRRAFHTVTSRSQKQARRPRKESMRHGGVNCSSALSIAGSMRMASCMVAWVCMLAAPTLSLDAAAAEPSATSAHEHHAAAALDERDDFDVVIAGGSTAAFAAAIAAAESGARHRASSSPPTGSAASSRRAACPPSTRHGTRSRARIPRPSPTASRPWPARRRTSRPTSSHCSRRSKTRATAG